MEVGYKLVDYRDGRVCFLYHGVSGSMTVPFNTWIKADKKLVSDGTGKKYLSGFHFFKKLNDAKVYINKFTTRKHLKRIVRIYVRKIWKKDHSRSPVYLAEDMKVVEEV